MKKLLEKMCKKLEDIERRLKRIEDVICLNDAESELLSETEMEIEYILPKIIEFVKDYKDISIEFLQRHLQISNETAAYLLGRLEELEVLSPTDVPGCGIVNKNKINDYFRNKKQKINWN